MDLGHAAKSEDLTDFVPVGQVLRGSHCHVCSEAICRPPSGSVAGPVTSSKMPSSIQLGIAVGDWNGVVSVMVFVTVGGGVFWSFLSCAFSTIRTAMTIARAPSTPAAHSSARWPDENVRRGAGV